MNNGKDGAKAGPDNVMATYGRFEIEFVEGEGARLRDAEGREYLDFLSGIAVTNLGHANPKVAEAIARQARKLVHVSNFFQIGPQNELARKLCDLSFADRVFFCNSGTEANEAALKLARKRAEKEKPGAFEIVSTRGSFHGRSMFSLSVTGQEKFHAGFAPMVPGSAVVSWNDLGAVEDAVSDKTAAVIVEPIQGEGGVNVPDPGYLRGLREICDRTNTLLVYDEVQTGMGRTGKLFAYEHEGAAPDVMTLAKALGNGFPIGAMLASEEAAKHFGPGSHGSTFGGNYLAAAAALSVLEQFEDGSLLRHVEETGEYLRSRLRELASSHDSVMDVRGRGLIMGMELDRPGKQAVESCLANGVIINCTADRVLRFIPPLIIEKADIDQMVGVLDKALAELEASAGDKG